jgi:ABC-type transport system involved in multi-copper enzyme maturation permease subunit
MMLVGGILLIVVALVIAGANSHKPTPADIARAEAFSQKEFGLCMSGRYLGRHGQVPPPYTTLEEYCHAQAVPASPDTGLKLGDIPDVIQHTGTFTVLLGVVLGASLMGADWGAGTMTTLLTWEPRRIRVLLTRALVAAIVIASLTLVLQAFLVGGFRLAVALRGTNLGSPTGLLGDAIQTVLRVSAMSVALGLVAMAVATIGRSTVAAVGVLFGYLVLFEGVIAGFRPSIQDRLLVRAAGVVISQQPIYDTSRENFGALAYKQPPLLGIYEAWIVAAVYVVVLMVLALLAFRTRDVN